MSIAMIVLATGTVVDPTLVAMVNVSCRFGRKKVSTAANKPSPMTVYWRRQPRMPESTVWAPLTAM